MKVCSRLQTPARFALVAFLLFVVIAQLTRLALVLTARQDLSWGLPLVKALGWGLLFDVCAGCFAATPWWLAGVVLPSRFLKSKWGGWIIRAGMFVFALLLVFIATAEWFFWDEFGARFNFIAVDYLIWTQEVLGNIQESYPMTPIYTCIALASAAVLFLLERSGVMRWALASDAGWRSRVLGLFAGLGLPALAMWLVAQSMIPTCKNTYEEEIAKNGSWSFFAAFRNMELPYAKWYLCLPGDEALVRTKKLLVTPDEQAADDAPSNPRRNIPGRGGEKHWNVIFICMESLSGDYMAYAGGNEGLTPTLDRLTGESLFFSNLYATGTRTVRGMEAITLNLPPTPGQAIIYRPDGVDLATTFLPFIDRGYDCAFFYGGDGRFDFMNRYFATAGCRIVDANAWEPADTTFETSWGACDEDLFNKTLKEADACMASGKPFNFFCMTTSNHRPYDFPAGRIDLPSHSGRRAAVKYADWAIGDFLNKAESRPWFANTLFVICSDHCASSAGKSEIDVTKYHIPAMIYAPSLVPARKVQTLCSQVDLMPTVMGLFGWSWSTLGYGHDLLAPSASSVAPRAFVSNYQKIGLMRDGMLSILKPGRKVSVYHCNLEDGVLQPAAQGEGDVLTADAVSYYQSASELFHSGCLKISSRPPYSPTE